jgi:hypothetical protein
MASSGSVSSSTPSGSSIWPARMGSSTVSGPRSTTNSFGMVPGLAETASAKRFWSMTRPLRCSSSPSASTTGTSTSIGLLRSMTMKSTWVTSRRTGWRCMSLTIVRRSSPSTSRVMRAFMPASVIRAARRSLHVTAMAVGSVSAP